MSQDVDQPVTRDAIEAKLRQIKGEVDTSANAAKPVALMIGVGLAVAVVGLAYVMGRRKGKKKTTLVEVRRV
ncbi:MAG TPA: hypothetical protein VM142_06720 [Acidimicrobiales bacterium]|nr:hypothetical protein [Acidimicrobiales bacterium]